MTQVGRLRGALHRTPGLPCRPLGRGERRRPAGRRSQLLRHPADRPRQRVGGAGEGTLARRRRAVRLRRRVAVPLSLAAPQVLRIGGERRQRALDRGAPEQLLTALQLGAELLLRFGESLERPAGRLRIELGQRLLQLAQSLLQLRGHRAPQQLLHFAQPRLKRRVSDARRLRRPSDPLHGTRQVLYARLQRLLIARHGLRPLGGLEWERPFPLALGAAARSGRVARALLGQVAGAPAQLALGRGDRVRLRARVPGGGTRRGAQLVEARQPQGDLGTATDVRRGSVVPGVDAQPQRVAGQETAPLRVEIALHDGPLARARHVQRLPHRLAHLPGLAHAPAHHFEPGETVIVPRVDHERLPQRQRQRGIPPGHGDGDYRCRIADQHQPQLGRIAFERRAIGGRKVEQPRPGAARREAPRERGARDRERHAHVSTAPRGPRERHARRPAGQDHCAFGDRDGVRAGRERLVRTAEVGGVARRQLEAGHERWQRHRDPDVGAAAAPARRSQVQVRLERPQPSLRVPQRVEGHRRGAPRLSRAAGPQRGAGRGGHVDRRRDAVAPAHRGPVDREPHRRARIGERAEGVPERGGAARTGRRGHEQRRAQHCHARGRVQRGARVAREQATDRGRGFIDHRDRPAVRQGPQVGARARRCGRRDEPDDASRPTSRRGFDQPRHGGCRRTAPCPNHQSCGRADDAADQQPGTHDGRDARGQRDAPSGDRQCGAGARYQHRARPRERMRASQPSQPGRRRRHGSALTA